MAMFKAFKPSGMQKIANSMGYQGDMQGFQDYLALDPMRQQQMQQYQQQATMMARGGMVNKYREGGVVGGVNPLTGTSSPQVPDKSVFTMTNGVQPQMPTPLIANKPMDPSMLTGGPGLFPGPIAQRRLTPDEIRRIEKNSDGDGSFDTNPIGINPPPPPKDDTSLSLPPPPQDDTTTTGPQIGQTSVDRMYNPALPTGGTTVAATVPTSTNQFVDPTTGQLTGTVAVPTAQAGTTQATAATETDANKMTAATTAAGVDSAMAATQAAQVAPEDPRAQITAAQQTASSVGDLSAAQGNAVLMENPVQRTIQDGELISGAANAQTASKFTEQIEAATATPTTQATVQGQLEGLMTQFEGGETPAWAAGAMRSASAAMAARGLGASSMAGQAVVQAAMESALPIAQADASTVAQFEAQNLSNRQQRAMLAAQQRATFMGQEFDQAFQARVQNASKISDVANMNFTAEQQVALENSRAANTMNLANLSNSQAMVMAEASALANMDMANLNNRQQSAVHNAQAFMQRDMANLSNQQQTELFKAQQRIQSLFTDQAATNAASQFNATSQNQVDQFFANLSTQTSQFNATQSNAQAQFNAGEANTVERFNAEVNNQRDQFNAQNQLVISQANAQWRREIATADTAAVNRANELNANAVLDISKNAYDNLWNYYADTMEWAWTSAESQLDRMNKIAIAELDAKAAKDIASRQASSDAGQAIGGLISTVVGGAMEHGWSNFLCWVAREVYGEDNIRWFIFRTWLYYKAPKWFYRLYKKHGKAYAKFISNKPAIKWLTKKLMDFIIEPKRKKLNVKVFI